MNFDYYYGDESNQFAFYRIPRQLITGEAFKKLSTDAKLLYGLLLDRMGLSAKNGWYDDMGRVFIYYTLDEIQEDLNCGHEKAVRLLAELDTGKKGFGLIERVKQGQGRPTKIYVKRFTTRIGGAEMPAEQVKGRLQMLDNGHLEYVFDCMRRNTTEIRNIRAYLLTALYNAPVTMSPYYQAAVQHDFSYPQRE